MNTHPTPTIEVFADIWCPFAHVGLRAVAEQRIALGCANIPLIVRSWPLELVNGAPMNPDKTKEHVGHLRDQVAPGLFCGFNKANFPTTTIPALALVACAYRASSTVGEAMTFAVRDALFEQGLDIADPGVLGLLAANAGVGMPNAADVATVTDDWHEGQRRGVVGSPHFFCGDVQSFCPSLNIERDPEHGMSITLNRSGITDFVSRCLAR